ncbi:MAG: thiodoxin-related protein [Idiomarinaceae bacterium HL-53]|nr:MAG: thiodoxin-related protein [Idiomarinaceae bacterium HL-53]CUS47732.1 Thioredoxin-related protein [Idiomarinaceae bacterium HL-53]
MLFRGFLILLASFLITPPLIAETLAYKDIDEAVVLAAEQRAIAENKQLLLVLGATWCHDSVALSEQFSEASVQEALNERYVVLGLNVGYLEHGFKTVERYGLPTYYGTPTVLIIDPTERLILNRVDYQIWTSAASMSDEDYQSYFFEQSFQHIDSLVISSSTQAAVFEYEQAQAQRIKAGYAIAGALLKAYKASNEPPTPEFMSVWESVAQYRNAIPRAVGQALATDSAEALPTFAAFPWENRSN